MEESLILSKETDRALTRLTRLVHHQGEPHHREEIGIRLPHLQDQQHALRKDVVGHLIIAMEVVEVSSGNDILDPDRALLLAAVAVDDYFLAHA